MKEIIKEYDAKIDNKKRLTLKDPINECFHIKQYKDGTIILEPNEISKKTLKMMDKSIDNYKKEKVSKAIDLIEL